MAVHAKSVITPIPDDVALYTALTDREDYTYRIDSNGNPNPNGFTDYSSYWQAVDAAILTHYSTPRTLDGFIEALYSDIVISGVLPLPSIYGAHLMKLNDVRTAVQATSLGFYADIPVPPPLPPKVATAANLDALVASIQGAFAAEQAIYDSLQAACVGRSRGFVHRQLFEDVPITNTLTKVQLGNLIYGSAAGELGYKAASLVRPIGSAAPSYVP